MSNRIKKSVCGILIDIDYIIDDLRQERNAWPDRFDDTNRIRLKELVAVSKKLQRLYFTLNKKVKQ
jgi:hypothetical protein